MEEITGAFDGVLSVWLIGSRADCSAKEDSDWDVLLFADDATLVGLRSCSPSAQLDVLVVVDGNRFEAPWIEDGYEIPKSGSLKEWQWTQVGETGEATYRGSKFPVGVSAAAPLCRGKRIYLRE